MVPKFIPPIYKNREIGNGLLLFYPHSSEYSDSNRIKDIIQIYSDSILIHVDLVDDYHNLVIGENHFPTTHEKSIKTQQIGFENHHKIPLMTV